MDWIASMRSLVVPLERRIRALATACTITQTDDSDGLQTVSLTLLAGERLAAALRVQPYGLSANPPPGAVGLAISVGGSRTHVLVLGGEDTSRPRNLPVGAAQLYDAAGNYVLLNNDGTVLVKAASKIMLDAPAGEATGNWTFDGSVHVKGTVTGDASAAFAGDVSSATSVTDPRGTMSALRDVYNGHFHNDPVTGVTGTPNELMP